MMHRRDFSYGTGYDHMLICLHLDEAVMSEHGFIERLESMLVLLQRRFGVPVVVGMAGFVSLTPVVLAGWIDSGLIEQSICSAHDSFTLNDLVDAAMRSHAEKVIFIDAKHLLIDLAGTIRFVVECKGRDRDSCSACGAYLYATVDSLRFMPSQWLHGSWVQRLRTIYLHSKSDSHYAAGVEQPLGYSENELPAAVPTSRHFFATREGVKRFGGDEELKNLPFLIGGAPLIPSRSGGYWIR